MVIGLIGCGGRCVVTGQFLHVKLSLLLCLKLEYEYQRQEPAPRRELAPPMLFFQTSPPCNIFTKITNFLRNRADFWPIIGPNYPDFGEIHASPRTKG